MSSGSRREVVFIALTSKRRDLPTISGRGRQTRTITPEDPRFTPVVSVTTGDFAGTYPKGSQVTASENHPSWRTRKGASSGDVGGEFSTVKRTITSNSAQHRIFLRTVNPGLNVTENEWLGPCYARNSAALSYPSLSISGDVAMDAWGAKAIANAKPTNALVDLSTTLGEMLGPGGIPRFTARLASWKTGIESALKSGADDFLNYQFGLAPIAADVVGFAVVVDQFHSLVKQYERDAGKVVRRRFSFEPIRTEANSELGAGMGPAMPAASSAIYAQFAPYPQGKVLLRRETEVRRWFSGAFTYHLPTGYSSRNSMLSFGPEAQKLLGIQPTPETLWNLQPWSWAIDWFTSAGDVVSNISDWSIDGLVMRYGYMMEHSSAIDTYYWSGSTPVGILPAPVVVTHESKQRRRANPFGFGLTWGGLSPRQLAIAASLGISRW